MTGTDLQPATCTCRESGESGTCGREGPASLSARVMRCAAAVRRGDSDAACVWWVRRYSMLAAAATAGAALLAAWLIQQTFAPRALVYGLLAIAYLLTSVYSLRRAWESLRAFSIDTNVMMVVGAALAVFIGEPFEGAILLFLFVMAGALEQLATGRAERAVQSLGEQFPTEAVVERDGRRVTVRIDEIGVGERLIVRPGDRVACDGRVIGGESHVDESAITGEFMPQAKQPDDPVYAGSLNCEQTLAVAVTSAAAESTLARVAAMVESARASKTRMESMIDRVGRWYGPCAFGASACMLLVARFAYGEAWAAAVYRAIALLIVASPCALMLATPVPVLCAIANAARTGIVAKGGAFFERLAAARVMFVDKTGTLTRGQVRLAAVTPLNGVDPERLLKDAAGLEHDSTHPLALAVMSAARAHGIRDAAAHDVRAEPGRGVVGRVDGREVRLGRVEWAGEWIAEHDRHRLMHEVNRAEREGCTPVVLAGDGAAGVLAFEDTVRPGALGLAAQLRAAGLSRVELLTGDRWGVGEALVRNLGLDACHAQLLPQDKLEYVSREVERGEGVVMVGDGVNDAPALARADVGIAMGGIGSHTALESADFVLLHDRVELLPYLVRLSHRTRRNMIQNIVFALAVIAGLAVWVAATGRPILSLSVLGHEGSTLLVVMNGLRMLRSERTIAAMPHAPPQQ